MSHCHSNGSCESHSENRAQSCGCGCCCNKGPEQKSGQGECNFAEKFLELADCAWMEVLKEKIKEQIRTHSKNLDELAAIIAEANHVRWHKKMEKKQCCKGFEEKVRGFFEKSGSGQCSHSEPNKPR